MLAEQNAGRVNVMMGSEEDRAKSRKSLHAIRRESDDDGISQNASQLHGFI